MKLSCRIILLISAVLIVSCGVQSATPSDTLQIDSTAIVPVLNNQATTSVVYIHNNSANNIDNISYTVVDNSGSSTSKFSVKQDSCQSIAANSSCALEFTTPKLSTDNRTVQGSSLIKAVYDNKGILSKSEQIINYAIRPAPNGGEIGVSHDVDYGNSQFRVIYLYAAAGSYDLKEFTSTNKNIKQISKSSQILNAPEVVAIELAANNQQTQSTVLRMDYTNNTNQQAKNLSFNLTVNPIANG
ncbi:MAG: hypothetical protein PHC75_10755, partial [Burkholderiales bacterium]|nr:hypothetical protein [Burkholderiales bacterium]